MKNKISRRQFLQVAGASAAALLLASCSGNSASSVSSSSVASSEAASSAAASSEATSTVTTTGKTLLVYFSATGTTQGVAQTIADTVGADLFEVCLIGEDGEIRDKREGIYFDMLVSVIDKNVEKTDDYEKRISEEYGIIRE